MAEHTTVLHHRCPLGSPYATYGPVTRNATGGFTCWACGWMSNGNVVVGTFDPRPATEEGRSWNAMVSRITIDESETPDNKMATLLDSVIAALSEEQEAARKAMYRKVEERLRADAWDLLLRLDEAYCAERVAAIDVAVRFVRAALGIRGIALRPTSEWLPEALAAMGAGDVEVEIIPGD